jgi:enoyl-CoA hydratase/carnithine racemase
MPNYRFIKYEQEGPIVTLTLNRPEALNAISRPLENELHTALEEADADDSVRAIILTGAGRAFSSGYDISRGESAEGEAAPAEVKYPGFRSSLRNPDMMLHIMELSKPVIAAVNGWCIGGGFWYALACDITIASDQAVFAQPEVRMISNTSVLFALLCGWKNAHRYALTGDHFDAQEALRIGVVNEVVPHDQLMDRARALARRLALVPRESVRINKMITTYGLEAMGLRNALNVNAFLSTIVMNVSDRSEVQHLEKARQEGGFRAFLEARDAPFYPEPFGPRSRPREGPR